MKRPEYTAGVVRIYRKYVDWYLQYGGDGYRVLEEDKKELLLLFNRDGFSRGYYEKHNGRELMALAAQKPDRQEKKAYEVLTAGLRRDYVEK
ncbi:U32 family peptidase, partial [Clostridium sp. HCS.1]|uniref:U32 family peptidase n=1 Tax=Clostridium sp. HCS.1 TaxID=3238594 RepID=UPI003A1030F0